jgi:3-phosphoshikimate 1-carboxyvinyltransferase
VRGVGGRWPASGVTLALGNSGTSVRFLAAAAMLASGPVTIDGTARMQERPIGELGELLTRLGCGVEYLGAAGFPPLRVTPASGEATSTLDVASFQSSQFVSAILLVGPWLPKGLTLRLTGPLTSAAYIQMTLGLLSKVGASVRMSEDLRVIRVGGGGGGGLAGFEYTVEPDATGATYFWGGAAMVAGARCAVEGLDTQSLQGDSLFPEVLGRMGARVQRGPGVIEVVGPRQLQPILADMSDMPDAAMTLAACACFANGTSILRGLRTLHVKECDRIAAMQAELTKLGVSVQTPVQNDADAMTITPPAGGVDCSPGAPPVVFETYDDHRMAMSLALIGLRRPNVAIRNPACVGKTYPGFWRDFGKFYS